jgi:hypothetical protein
LKEKEDEMKKSLMNRKGRDAVILNKGLERSQRDPAKDTQFQFNLLNWQESWNIS